MISDSHETSHRRSSPALSQHPSVALVNHNNEPATELDLDREIWRHDPVLWVGERLNETLWSKQRAILNSVRDHRRTAVQSAHGIGKSWTAARVVAWWLDVHPPGQARVITSAPTGDQVKAILWNEIGRAHSSGKLPGRLNQTEWWMPLPDGREELVAFGRKPAEHNPTAFQGIHERYVLVVFDEAAGIPGVLWEAADSLISNDDSRFLSIGNPDDPLSEFAAVCKPGSGVNVIRVSAFDTPNFTGETIPDHMRHRLVGPVWVEEKRRKWGETNPLYIAKVLGEFPENTTDGLIPMQWIKAAQERSLPASLPIELGTDVGGGGDRSVTACRRGPHVRIIRRDQNPDTMQTAGNLIADIRDTSATVAKVDEIGIGRGLVDRLKEQKKPVIGINVGQQARDSEAYANLRAEGYWGLRERFQEGSIDIDPADEDLAAQLVDIKYKRTSSGRIQIESKDEMKRRGKPSPDDADAVMLAFLQAKPDVIKVRVSWGRKQPR